MTEQQTPNNVQGDGQQSEDGGRVFTQEDIDRIVSDRLQRERAKYADYDDLKSAADRLAEIEAEQLSELERERKAREAAEQAAEAARTAANETLARAAFIAEAAKAGAAHPEDAYALADRSAVQVGDDGNVNGVAEAVAQLVDAGRLVMTGKPKAPNLDGGAGSGDRPGDKAAALTQEEINTARKMHMTPEEYAKYKEA